ncbi:MAG: Mur ligase family protein [Planctomycetota bacterium]
MRRATRKRPPGVRLAEVLETTLPPALDVYATTCTDRVSSVRQGDVYCVPDVEATAAARLAQAAVAAGAQALITGQLLPIVSATQFVVADVAEAYGKLCQALVGAPATEMHLTAVTGSFGKSAVVGLLRSIAVAAGRQPSVLDRGVADDLVEARRLESDSPSPPATARWLARGLANGSSHAIAEVGCETPTNATKADTRADGFAGVGFGVMCVTNAAPRSNSQHASLEDQRAAIHRSLRGLKPRGVLVVNADDQECCRLLSRCPGAAITFGFSDKADVRGTVLRRHTAGQVLLIQHGAESAAVETSTVGDAHAANCLAATATAIASGATLQQAAAGIENASPAPRVMQPVVCGQSFAVYLDAAASPVAVAEATRAAGAVTSGRVLTAFCAPAPRPSAVDAARPASDVLMIAGRETGPGVSGDSVRVLDDPFSAIALALALAEAGDTVVLLACGADRERAGGGEEAVVRQLLHMRIENEQETAKAG